MNDKADKVLDKPRQSSIQKKPTDLIIKPIKLSPSDKQLKFNLLTIQRNEPKRSKSPQSRTHKEFQSSNADTAANKEYYEQFLKSITDNKKTVPSSNITNERSSKNSKKNIRFTPIETNEFKNVQKISFGIKKNQSSKSMHKKPLTLLKIDETNETSKKKIELKRHETVIDNNKPMNIIQRFYNDKRRLSVEGDKISEALIKKDNGIHVKEEMSNQEKAVNVSRIDSVGGDIPIDKNKDMTQRKRRRLSWLCCIPLSRNLIHKSSQGNIVVYSKIG